ncbi:MAG TPA: DUF2232 domain-containing protein [bacterium]|nr:DUF2232 domain-containing protein [bacterium]
MASSTHSAQAARRHPTRGLTEGAILAALTAIIAAVGLLAPPVAVLLSPLPIMLLVIRWGMRIAVLASVIAALALLQFAGPLNAASAVAMFAPLGLALGWGVRRGLAAQWTILGGSIAFLIATMAMLAAASGLMHQDVMGDFIAGQIKAMQMAMGLQQRMGAPAEQVRQMRQAVEMLPRFLRSALPVALALGALLWSYLCYTVARAVLRRVGHPLPAVPPILTWRLSAGIASIMLWAGAIASLAAMRAPVLGGVALDAMLVNLFVFGFQGTLVGVTWANRRGYPAFVQALFGFMLLGAGILPLFGLAILGMLDTWWDFRRLRPRGGGTPAGTDAGPGSGDAGGSSDAGRSTVAGRLGRPAAGAATKVVHQR